MQDLSTQAALEVESLLDLARFKYPSVMLNYHYRAKYEELINLYEKNDMENFQNKIKEYTNSMYEHHRIIYTKMF